MKKSNGGAVDDWPGVSETTSKGKDGAGFPVQWDQAPATNKFLSLCKKRHQKIYRLGILP